MPTRDRTRRAALALACAAALAPAAGRGGEGSGDPAKVEVADLDLESLLDLSVEAVALHEERASEASASVFVLSGDDLRRQGFRTLHEALSSVPGLFGYSDGLYPMVGVRGLGTLGDYTTRLLVLVDGHPLNNSLGIGESYLGRDLPVPLAAVRRLEVIQGPVGSVYGPTAFLGVVNLVTGAPPGGEASLSAEGAAGAVGGGEGTLVLAGGGAASWFVAAAGHGTRGADWTFPELAASTPGGDGRVRGVDFADAQQAYARVAWRDFTASASCGRFHRGLPSAAYASLVGDRRNTLDNQTCFAQLAVERAVTSALTLDARASYDEFRYGDTLAYPEPPEGFGLFRDDGRDRWVAGELRATWRPSPGAHLAVGATGESHDTRQHSYNPGLPSLREDPVNGVGLGVIEKRFATLNVYLVAQRRLGPVTLHAGLTWYGHELFGARLTPKLAAVWQASSRDTFKAIYSEGFRAPTASEAFFEDGATFLANPGLRPETVRSVEALWLRQLGGVASLSAGVFQHDYRDLIRFDSVYVPDPASPDPADPLQHRQLPQNADRLRLRGAELGLLVRWRHLLQAWGGVSVQDLGQRRPNFAPVTGSLAVSTRALWRPLTLSLRGAALAARAKDATAAGLDRSAAVPATLRLDAFAALEVPGLPGLAVEAGVQNLNGAAGLDPVPGDFAPISQLPQPTRSFRAGARWRF
jgi:iron complex outermembrane receptor protein